MRFLPIGSLVQMSPESVKEVGRCLNASPSRQNMQFALPCSPVVLQFALNEQEDEAQDNASSKHKEGKRCRL
jgi:hypothetical protein